MKTQEEIEQLALLKYPKFSSDSYNPEQDDNYYERLIWIEGYTQCQEDMVKIPNYASEGDYCGVCGSTEFFNGEEE